jgi:hypothetical protein
MKCRTQNDGGCGYEFRWICGHEWTTYQGDGYRCNKYVDFENVSRDSLPKGDLSRLTHYYTRYLNHQNSLETELTTKEETRRRLIERFQRRDTHTFSDRRGGAVRTDIVRVRDRKVRAHLERSPHVLH